MELASDCEVSPSDLSLMSNHLDTYHLNQIYTITYRPITLDFKRYASVHSMLLHKEVL